MKKKSMFVMSLFFYTTLLHTNILHATLKEDMDFCNSKEKNDKNKINCKITKLIHEMQDKKSKDQRHFMILSGCKNASLVPDGYLNGWRGFKSVFTSGGMGEDYELQNKCYDTGAQYLEANQEKVYSLSQQIGLLRAICNVSDVSANNDEREMNLQRRHTCYTQTFSESTKSELTDAITFVDSKCNLRYASVPHIKAENYLAEEASCVDAKLSTYVDDKVGPVVNDTARGKVKERAPLNSPNGPKGSTTIGK